MAHTSDEITVGCGNAALAFCKNSHITAEAGSAGGRGNNGACVNKRRIPSVFDTVAEYLHGAGDNDAANAVGNLFAV